MKSRIICLALASLLLIAASAGCNGSADLSYDDAVKELDALTKRVSVNSVEAPIDIYVTETPASATLADISTFPLVVEGRGEINIEVAAATEMSAASPDDWMVLIAERFNNQWQTIDGKTVSVSVRRMASGEVVTYMAHGGYKPDVYAPSVNAWGDMLKASGFNLITVSERIIGNTAGVLMEKGVYNDFVSKYGDVAVDKVLDAHLAGDIVFCYTNPYTSSTGLNTLTAMLHAFDPNNPLSAHAAERLLEYQRRSPPVAYTTAVLRDQAAKGIISAMVMEEQAYINTPQLKDYVFTPWGMRHDHPVYTFDYVSAEKQEAAKLFADFCLTADSQALAREKGFNRNDSYVEQTPGLDGAGFIAAQDIWKLSKDGGYPVVAVFVADISGSMDGLPLNSLKESLVNTAGFIGSNNYVGLISYSSQVYLNLPVREFNDTQRAYFSGAVKSLRASGSTATYDAVLVACQMLLEAQKSIPDSKLMMFVLSDGDQNEGYNLSRVAPIIGGLRIPIYTIAYNLTDGSRGDSELQSLSGINEAVRLKASSDDIINQLRNLFNVQM
ncbi:MAG: VWA domain-containing protein [Oscillospiraceae bacterium]|nr:VWA domain-containing protein [Oscillospiraceae bacterium]